MIAVETLHPTAFPSAFIGLIALFVLSRPAAEDSLKLRGFLGNLVVLAAVVALGSFLVDASSPHGVARSAYGAARGGPLGA